MNPALTTTIGHADPNATPITVNEFIDLLNTLIATQFTSPDSYLPYIISQTTPSVDDRDKVWIELDTAGRPLSTKIWYPGAVAAWRRIYNGMIGEIRGYSGNPGYTSDPSSDFDINGAGQVGGRYDGWQICNGKNGSPDLSNQFLVGANMSNATGTPPGYDNGWQCVVEGTAYMVGGFFKHTLQLGEIPVKPNTPPGTQIPLYRWQADGNAGNPFGNLYGVQNNADTNPQYTVPPTTSNTTPDEFWTTPPFYALAWIIFGGY